MIPPLPTLMVAPNGARKTTQDHPALPVTTAALVETAISCHAAGADAIHLHIRDAHQHHTLDSEQYRHTLEAISDAIPELAIQITTEAVGLYTPPQQRQVVRDVMPDAVSIALSEMLSDHDWSAALPFYQWCQHHTIAVQHIIYTPEQLTLLSSLLERDPTLAEGLQLMFVLGRYTPGQESNPDDLMPFLTWLTRESVYADWAVCAFGRHETRCLERALMHGGKVRVGFENSLLHSDGSVAIDNAARVSVIKALVDQLQP